MNIEIANRLIKLRKEKGYSQETLADALGISRQAVSKWERAESSPDTDNLICLAKLYGISLDELLKTEDDVETIKKEQINNETSDKSFIQIEKDNIHVVDDEDEIHISIDGIKIKEKSENSDNNKNPIIKFLNAGFPILCVIVYLLLGSLFDIWHPGWIIFLLIPIWYSLIDAIYKKNPSEFAYPVLVVFFYILFSDLFGVWHPLWILFITIPIYYTICDQLKNKK